MSDHNSCVLSKSQPSYFAGASPSAGAAEVLMVDFRTRDLLD